MSGTGATRKISEAGIYNLSGNKVAGVLPSLREAGRMHWQTKGHAPGIYIVKVTAEGEKIAVILGDNIIEKDIKKAVRDFKRQPSGAKILLKKVHDPERFGVVKFKKGKISAIVEKPKKKVSSYAVTGIYMYDNKIFDIIKTLKPSRRGELEITDVNNAYIKRGELTYDILKGWWTDSGTFDSLLRASELVAKRERSKAKGKRR